MSGETKSAISAWTIDSLKELMHQRVMDMRDMIDQRDRLYNERALAQDKAISAALAAAGEAAEKTEESLKEYKISSNEWRDTVKDLVSRMPSRTEMDALEKTLLERLERQEKDLRDLRESRAGGEGAERRGRTLVDSSRANLGTIISLIVAGILLFRIMTGR